MAAGLARLGASVVGFDPEPTDLVALERVAKARGVDVANLDVRFRLASAGGIEAADGAFDLAVSWSVFEHVFDREGYVREAHRVIKPYGHFFVQVWPLWFSEHGHHLWRWLRPFDHLRYSRDEIVDQLRSLDVLPAAGGNGSEPQTLSAYLREAEVDLDTWVSTAMSSYDSCNQITIDEIQTLLLEHGFGIGRVEVMTSTFHVPEDLQNVPLSRLVPSGFKLIAWRMP
jgi:SAM-dependent methyltransferase